MDDQERSSGALLSGPDLEMKVYEVAYHTAAPLALSHTQREAREDVLLAAIARALPEVQSFQRQTVWSDLIRKRLVERFGTTGNVCCRFLSTPELVKARIRARAAEEARLAQAHEAARTTCETRDTKGDRLVLLQSAVARRKSPDPDQTVPSSIMDAPQPIRERKPPEKRSQPARVSVAREPEQAKPPPALPSIAFAYHVLETYATTSLGGRRKIGRPASYLSIVCHISTEDAHEVVAALVAATCLKETENSHRNRPEYLLLSPPPS